MDPAHEQTEAIIKRMEKALMQEYQEAAREIKKKADKYLSDFKVKDATWQKMLADGEVTERDYKNWRTGQIMTGKRWTALQEQIAENMVHANQIAHSIAYGYQPEAYALNLNFATYEVEHSGKLDTNYTLYDKQTVERIMREDPDMLPPPRTGGKIEQMIAENKDLRWNRQRVSSVMMQGIMQGEPIEKLATRLAENVATSNYKSAVRYARTMTTNTQNAGRYEGYRRATKMGVDLTIEWSATLDNRTRHNHRMLHGQRRNVDEPFEVDGIKILYPAELNGKDYKVPESMIWNCRCTLLAWVKGFEGETVKSSPKMGDMSFEEWQNMKEDDPRYKAAVRENSDRKMFAEYKQLLGKDAPQSFLDFQTIKYYNKSTWEELKSKARNVRIDKEGAAAKLSISMDQFGKKIGKHAMDYGLSPNNSADRDKMLSIIQDIFNNRDELRRGKWRGQQDRPIFFSIKGEDVVVTRKDGTFISILKGGVNNERVKNARRIEI